jgi:malonyl CoA-acyl carrier protein transacylase
MLAYLFPGQGSQFCGMGNNLFDEFPDLVAQADDVLGYSIKKLCLEDPAKQLNQTQYTQPAMYTVNALSYYKKLRETKQKPDFVAGHSLGEYNALLAAEIFDFATGLKLVKKRGELMSQATGGGMAAIVDLQESAVKEILQQHHFDNIIIANYNSYTQFVLSGPKNEIERAQSIFKNYFIPLNVSGAFHSPYMLPAQQEFSKTINQMTFTMPVMPVIANVNAESYHPKITATNLAQQITSPVQWVKTIEYLMTQGDLTFSEVGPGNVLSGLMRHIKAGEKSVTT